MLTVYDIRLSDSLPDHNLSDDTYFVDQSYRRVSMRGNESVGMHRKNEELTAVKKGILLLKIQNIDIGKQNKVVLSWQLNCKESSQLVAKL